MRTREILEKAQQFCEKHNITKYPVRIVDICKAEKITVFEQYLPKGMSGFIVIQNEEFAHYGTGRLIVVNLLEGPDQRRLTIARELAHYILRVDEGEDVFAHRAMGEDNEMEREANLFAANILMPKTLAIEAIDNMYDGDSRELPNFMKAEHFARKFAVSRDAASTQIMQLKI
jgi:Zn-dependent peptidase ImmA (M78 family)